MTTITIEFDSEDGGMMMAVTIDLREKLKTKNSTKAAERV